MIFLAGPPQMDAPERTRSLSRPNRICQLSIFNYDKCSVNKFHNLRTEYLAHVRLTKRFKCTTFLTCHWVGVRRELLARAGSLA